MPDAGKGGFSLIGITLVGMVGVDQFLSKYDLLVTIGLGLGCALFLIRKLIQHIQQRRLT